MGGQPSVAIGRLKNKKKSYKHREREKQEAERAAAEAALATEQAMARQVEDQVKRHQRLIIAGIAIVIVGGAVYATQESASRSEAGALTQEWGEAAKTLNARVTANAKEASDDPNAVLEFENDEARYSEIEAQFEAVQASAQKGPVYRLANLPLAAASLGTGDGAKAQERLQAFLDGEDANSAFRLAAEIRLAHALEADGKASEGAQKLASMAQDALDTLAQLQSEAETNGTEDLKSRIDQERDRSAALLLDAAQMHRRSGANDEAVKILKRLSEDEVLQASTLSTRVDRELRILGEGG